MRALQSVSKAKSSARLRLSPRMSLRAASALETPGSCYHGLSMNLVCPIFCTSFIVSVARLSLLIDSRSRGCGKWEARSGFHFSIPQALCHPDLWRWWSIAQRGVWPHRVVVDAPPLRQHPDLLHRVEDFTVQELVS